MKKTYQEILNFNVYSAYRCKSGEYLVCDNFGKSAPIPAEQWDIEIVAVYEAMKATGWTMIDAIQSFLRHNPEMYICYN